MARQSAQPKAKDGPRSASDRASAPSARERTRSNDPDRTKANILEVATHEFSEKGLSGARIDEIAERTRTSKRMIYYYFESKEGLYRAVLEDSLPTHPLDRGDARPRRTSRRSRRWRSTSASPSTIKPPTPTSSAS